MTQFQLHPKSRVNVFVLILASLTATTATLAHSNDIRNQSRKSLFTKSSPDLIDPVDARLLSYDADNIAASDATVSGVAADGTTEVILRIPSGREHEHVTITVLDDSASESHSTAKYGALSALDADGIHMKTSLTVIASQTRRDGPLAFAFYRAPTNFSRGPQDDSLRIRIVNLLITAPDKPPLQLPITIARPPVILVHGLWADPSAFDNFDPLIDDSRFTVSRASYNQVIPNVTQIDPVYASHPSTAVKNQYDQPLIRANSLGFEYNANSVLAQINNFIAVYRHHEHIAATTADVVAHSMGGDVVRTIYRLPDSRLPEFGEGPVNKLITIATPHLGSPLPADLLNPQNYCVRNILGATGQMALASATFAGNKANGAMTDLQGDISAGQLSAALQNLNYHTGAEPFRIAYIAAIAGDANVRDTDCDLCLPCIIRAMCGSEPMVNDLRSRNWLNHYHETDAIVPAQSALNNTTGFTQPGLIHSSALENLGFDGPGVLDAKTPVALLVIKLLNEDPASSDFH